MAGTRQTMGFYPAGSDGVNALRRNMTRLAQGAAERREQGRMRGDPQRGARQYRRSTVSAERGRNDADGPRSSYASAC
jgi:hypothetical protein